MRARTLPVPATPSLTRLDPPTTPGGPEQPRSLVLMLHGGTVHSRQPVDARSASWRRTAAMQRAITPRLHAAGVATWLLRFAERGWNGDGADRVRDVRWALDEVRHHLGAVPVVLLGHSMGARTAVHVADDPAVRGVVALAPWLPAGEPVVALAGRSLWAAHGRTDRITSARATAVYVERARRLARSAHLQDMGRVGHYMLRRVPAWNDVAAERSLAGLPFD